MSRSTFVNEKNRRNNEMPEAPNFALIDALTENYKTLRSYLGESNFTLMARTYFAAQGANSTNVRWHSENLLKFAKHYGPFKHNPELIELTLLEFSMNRAFEAPDVRAMTIEELKLFTKSTSMVVKSHPSMSTLTFEQNTVSIWSALRCESLPPKPHRLDTLQKVVIWRQGATPRFRILGDIENHALAAITKGANFKQICKAVKAYSSMEETEHSATKFLSGWVEAQLLVA